MVPRNSVELMWTINHFVNTSPSSMDEGLVRTINHFVIAD